MNSKIWTRMMLGEVVDTFIDYRGKTPKKTAQGIPLITAKIVKDGFIHKPNEFITESDYAKWMTKGLPRVGDVVLTVEAPLGEVAQLKESRVALAQRVITMRGKLRVLDNAFLKYFLQSSVGQERLKARETGTTVTGIKQSELKLVEIDLPSYEEQRSIANILSSLDEKIELNNHINETLAAIAQAIFKEWFVDFNFLGATGKMQDSELGNLPSQMKVGRLIDFVVLNPKLTLRTNVTSKYVEMKDLSESSAIIKKYAVRPFSSGSKFQNGDTLLARITPCLENGKTGLVSFLDKHEVGWGSTEFIVMRGKADCYRYFVYCLSRSETFRSFAIQSMTGSSGRQRVVESILATYKLPIPEIQLAEKFDRVVSPMFDAIFENEKQSSILRELRGLLLPKLLKGEMSIKETEKEIASAL